MFHLSLNQARSGHVGWKPHRIDLKMKEIGLRNVAGEVNILIEAIGQDLFQNVFVSCCYKNLASSLWAQNFFLGTNPFEMVLVIKRSLSQESWAGKPSFIVEATIQELFQNFLCHPKIWWAPYGPRMYFVGTNLIEMVLLAKKLFQRKLTW